MHADAAPRMCATRGCDARLPMGRLAFADVMVLVRRSIGSMVFALEFAERCSGSSAEKSMFSVHVGANAPVFCSVPVARRRSHEQPVADTTNRLAKPATHIAVSPYVSCTPVVPAAMLPAVSAAMSIAASPAPAELLKGPSRNLLDLESASSSVSLGSYSTSAH